MRTIIKTFHDDIPQKFCSNTYFFSRQSFYTIVSGVAAILVHISANQLRIWQGQHMHWAQEIWSTKHLLDVFVQRFETMIFCPKKIPLVYMFWHKNYIFLEINNSDDKSDNTNNNKTPLKHHKQKHHFRVCWKHVVPIRKPPDSSELPDLVS